jgi:chromosome segregation ATPase
VTPFQWFQAIWMVLSAAVLVTLWLYRKGYVVGGETAQLKAKLAEFQKLIDDAGQRMSDRIKGLQQLVTSIEVIKLKLESLHQDQQKRAEDHEKIAELFGAIRERIARMEARQWPGEPR